MADENSENLNDPQPPKIKINGNGHAAPGEKPAESAASATPPPKFQSEPRQPKEQTARIDFASAVAPSTVRLTTGKPPAPTAKKATSKIDLGAGVQEMSPQEIEELSKRSTIRITSPVEMKPMSSDDKEAAAKKSTVRIDETASMQPITDEQKEEAIKKSTVRIDTVSDMKPMTPEDREESAKKTTARVLIDEDRLKGDTTRIEPATSEPSDMAKKRTARIDLGEVLDDEDDIFKRRTALLDPAKLAGATDAPGAPRTIRIKRPGASAAPQAPVAEPAAEEVVAPISQAEAARKSETARIDLPPEVAEQPPTRRKTIRIKRPGSTTSSKPLVITRTPSEAAREEGGAAPVRAQEEDSPLFAWVAVAAVLVAVVLIYVLASQVGTVAELAPARFPYAGSL